MGRRSRPRSPRSRSGRTAQFAGVQGTVRDVTQQERLERELRESQERYRFLVENSPDVVFSTDAEGLFTFMSEVDGADDRLEARRGHRRAISPRSSSAPACPSARDPLGGAHGRSDDASRSRTSTSRDRTAGSSRSRSARSAMVDDDGRFAGIHGSTRDISERDAPRTRAARIRGALPLPRRLVAGPRLADRRGGHADVHQRRGPADARHRADRADGPALRGDLRAEPRGATPTVRFRWLARHPTRGPPDAAAVPSRRRPRRAGRDQRDGHDRGRRLHRGARRRPRRQRARPARTRPAPPGGRARGRRGARAPRPRAARLGHPGALLDDPRVALGGDAARPRRGGRRGPSSSSCATCSARPWPRCGR